MGDAAAAAVIADDSVDSLYHPTPHHTYAHNGTRTHTRTRDLTARFQTPAPRYLPRASEDSYGSMLELSWRGSKTVSLGGDVSVCA